MEYRIKIIDKHGNETIGKREIKGDMDPEAELTRVKRMLTSGYRAELVDIDDDRTEARARSRTRSGREPEA